jgi:hypothetical protein
MRNGPWMMLLAFALNSCGAGENTRRTAAPPLLVNQAIGDLEKIIDLSVLKPEKVWFQYGPVVPASDDDLVPGPTDYKLEAMLQFSDSSFNKLVSISAVTVIKNLKKDELLDYQFQWLTETDKKMIREAKDIVQYSADKFYKGGLIHGNYMVVNKFVFLYLYTM